MTVRVSGKQMEVGEAFSSRIRDRIAASVSKHVGRGFSARVTLEKSGAGYSADCTVSLDTGTVLQASGSAFEPQVAFDAAAERIEKQLRRYGRRLKKHDGAPRAAYA